MKDRTIKEYLDILTDKDTALQAGFKLRWCGHMFYAGELVEETVLEKKDLELIFINGRYAGCILTEGGYLPLALTNAIDHIYMRGGLDVFLRPEKQ